MKKSWWEHKRQQWKSAITAIARERGEGSHIYIALGSAAWGRTPYEGDNLQSVIAETAYLHGVRDALMALGDSHGMPGAGDLRRISDRFREVPDGAAD